MWLTIVVLCVLWSGISLSEGMEYCSEIHNIHNPLPTTGLIQSPNFPSPFPAPIQCTYNLSTSNSNVIHLIFTHFDLAPRTTRSNQCLESHIVIMVIDRNGRQHIGDRICSGDELSRRFETMQPNIIIQFTSHSNDVRNGFKIEYQFISEASIRQPQSLYYDLDRTYEAACGGRNEVGRLSGEIISPGYPLTFPRNITCNWLIRVEPRQKIYIRVVQFNFADIKECEFGTLHVIDGYRHESAFTRRDEKKGEISEARFCGNLQFYQEDGLRSYISTGNRIIIRFSTGTRTPPKGSEVQKVGFRLIWTAVESIVEDSSSSHSSVSSSLSSSPSCAEFTCNGGHLCVDQEQGICQARSQFCIHSSLVCNGIPNCVEGDYSDEQHCYSREIGLAGGVGLILLIAVIGIVVCCERRRKRKSVEKATRHEGTNSSKNGGPIWEDAKKRPNSVYEPFSIFSY